MKIQRFNGKGSFPQNGCPWVKINILPNPFLQICLNNNKGCKDRTIGSNFIFPNVKLIVFNFEGKSNVNIFLCFFFSYYKLPPTNKLKGKNQFWGNFHLLTIVPSLYINTRQTTFFLSSSCHSSHVSGIKEYCGSINMDNLLVSSFIQQEGNGVIGGRYFVQLQVSLYQSTDNLV